MEKECFKFRVQNLSCGWCRVLMLINDKEIYFNAEYMGPNPLASFIDACAELMEECGEYSVTWLYHDVALSIEMELDEKSRLYFDIIEKEKVYISKEEKYKDIIREEWHESIPFDAFVSVILSEGFRVLNAFGLYGYQRSWQNHEDFPLTNLLRMTGRCKELWKGDSCSTDLTKEIEVLQEVISKLEITEETMLDACSIYYESWQLQCCGEAFSVGDRIEWTCVMAKGYKNAHGIIMDFEEDHHGFATHGIIGTVVKIIAERSEFQKGQKEVWYDRAKTIHEELRHADGKESYLKEDENTERIFWGYIVELKDVTVKPIQYGNRQDNINGE